MDRVTFTVRSLKKNSCNRFRKSFVIDILLCKVENLLWYVLTFKTYEKLIFSFWDLESDRFN